MESVSDSSTVEPVESDVPKSDLSILIDDLCQFNFDDDSIRQTFDSAVKDFEDSSSQIREIRVNKEIVIEKLHQQYNDHAAASELLNENAKLFEEIQQLLPPRSESPSSVEEWESFLSEKLLLEEAIEKYQNEIPVLESQHTAQMEELKSNHDMEQNRLNERERSLESQIKTYMEDFERQKAELKIKHEKVLESLSSKFKSRLSEIEELGSHKQCESELASLRSSWNETLQGLALAIERTTDEFSAKRLKKRRSSSTVEVPKERRTDPLIYDSVSLVDGNVSCLRECKVVIERLEESAEFKAHLNRSKSKDEVSPNSSVDTHCSPQSSSSTSSASKKRLFSEEQIQGTLGAITDTTPGTIEEYLKSLQRIVSENTKEQKRLKRRKSP